MSTKEWGPLQDGSPIDGVSMPAGGAAGEGWLSAIYNELATGTFGGGGGGAVTLADGADATLGAKADAAASTDTGTASQISLIKRLLQRVSTLLGQLPSALTGSGNLKVALSESTATQTVSGTVSVNALPAGSNTIGGIALVDSAGTNKASISAAGAVKVDNSAQTQPISGTVTILPTQSTLTDRSGTLTTGGTAQQMMAANASRKTLFIQNNGAGDLWINFTTTAVQSQPSIYLPGGSSFAMDRGFVCTEAVSVIGATTGQAWTAKEG